MGEDDRNEKDSTGIWIAAGVAMAVVIGLWVATWIFVPNWYPGGSERGQFGDMFGSVNALFSGLAFVGVVIAILLQWQELKAQRKDLELTRQEVRGQKEQLALQAQTMQIQQFEATFFQMIRLHHDLVAGFLYPKDHRPTGRAAIAQCLNREGMRPDLYRRIQALLGVDHYFRNFREIVRYMVRNNREEYLEILRAQMSNDEQTILFLYCLDRQDTSTGDELLRYVTEYRLLAHWETPEGLLELRDKLPEDSYGIKLKSSM